MVDQGARLVDIALETGDAFEGDGFKYIQESFADHTLHFIGLLSNGGVHSRADQLYGFIKGAADRGAKRIRVHILTVRLFLFFFLSALGDSQFRSLRSEITISVARTGGRPSFGDTKE